MADNPQPSDQQQPSAYEDRVSQQQALVRDVAERYQQQPSPELLLELRRKTDTLRHIQNLAKGKPGERARKAAETAKKTALSKAFA